MNPQQPHKTWGMGGVKGEEKWRWEGTGAPEGWLGEGRSSYTQQDPPTVRGPGATGKTLGETVGEGHEGMEGNRANAFPVHLGTRKPVGLWGLILCTWSLPSATQSPSPAPTPPPRALPLHSETPSNELGLNPTHTPLVRALPPNSGSPHSKGPPFHVLPLPFWAGPKQGPHPHLNVPPA